MRSALVLVLLSGVIGISFSRPISLYKKNMDWDHYIFVQQYPAGWCAYNVSKGVRCGYPSNASDWTIHGLWPTLGDSKGPNFCNNSAKFDMSSIDDLSSKLTTDWTDLHNSTPYYSFWKHEWVKHGTCSDFPDEHSFFAAVLKRYETLGFGSELAQYITPSKQGRNLKDFLNAFRMSLGASPHQLDCQSHGGMQYLVQVGMCLDKDMKVIACPSDPAGSCNSDNPIIYAPSIYTY